MRDIIEDEVVDVKKTKTILNGCCLVFEDIPKCEESLPDFLYSCLKQDWVCVIFK